MDFRGYDNNYPLGIRCNNPLNVSDDNWEGQVGVYPNANNEAIFQSTLYGLRAAVIVLYSYFNNHNIHSIAGIMTGIVNRWAPASDGNDPVSYANYVAQKTGLSVNSTINPTGENIKKILKAMVQVELGPSFATMIPDAEYDIAITMAGNTGSVSSSSGNITVILLLVAGVMWFSRRGSG